MQGHFTVEEWETRPIHKLISLHLIRECLYIEYQAADEILELIIRVKENKN